MFPHARRHGVERTQLSELCELDNIEKTIFS